MFSLVSGCFEFMLRKEELHVLIVGLDKAGKTTLLERLKTLYTDVPGLEASQVVPTGEAGAAAWCPPALTGHAALHAWQRGVALGLRSAAESCPCSCASVNAAWLPLTPSVSAVHLSSEPCPPCSPQSSPPSLQPLAPSPSLPAPPPPPGPASHPRCPGSAPSCPP